MTLRDIADFELALLDPCLAMSERGVQVDDTKRLGMIATLGARRAPLVANARTIAVGVIQGAHKRPPKAHLFHEQWTCGCCRGGGWKQTHCWTCAGFAKSPTRNVDKARLRPCVKCDGVGKRKSLTFNPDSDEQIKIVLYELLALPKRTKDGKLRSDEDALKTLLGDDTTGLVMALLQIAKLSSIASYLERISPHLYRCETRNDPKADCSCASLPHARLVDGRIRTFYNPAGTETGRFSSSGGSPDAQQSTSERWALRVSTNLQNLPKREAIDSSFDVRSCLVPDDGHVFVEADLSGAEAWITAACCGDVDLLTKLKLGQKVFDVHVWTASKLYGIPVEQVDKKQRATGKTARHALNYGMQPQTFERNVNSEADKTGVTISKKDAQRIHFAYHQLHPLLDVWWKRVQAGLHATSSLTTVLGRRRTFFGRDGGLWLGETHREAIAFEPQSTVADVLNRGLLRWWRQYDGKLGTLLLQVHDAVLVQCRRDRAPLVVDALKRCLSEQLTVNGIELTIPVDVVVSDDWGVT